VSAEASPLADFWVEVGSAPGAPMTRDETDQNHVNYSRTAECPREESGIPFRFYTTYAI
jgi:hypothetical protein